MEVLDVCREWQNIAIVRRDDDQRPPHVLPKPRNEEGARRARKTGHHDITVALQGFGSDAAEIRGRGNPGKNLRYALIENFHDRGRAPEFAQ